MGGFGSGGFGKGPFGKSDWSRAVLWDHLPEIYRREDDAAEGLLRAWVEAIRSPFDVLRNKIDSLNELRDPTLISAPLTGFVNLRLGPVVAQKAPVEQAGIMASVNALREFNAPGARFDSKDAGKTLEVYGSTNPSNNKSVTVTNVIDPYTVLTSPSLEPDSKLRWVLRSASNTLGSDETHIEVWSGDALDAVPGSSVYDGVQYFEVTSRHLFDRNDEGSKRILWKEGADGFFAEVAGTVLFLSPSANFDIQDIGRVLSVSDGQGSVNEGQYQIFSVIASSELAAFPEHTGVELKARNATALDAAAEVSADPTPVYWAVLPRPILTLKGSVRPKGTVLKHGFDATVLTTTTISVPSGSLSEADIGLYLFVNFAASPGGAVPGAALDAVGITNVDTSQSIITVSPPLQAAYEGSGRWAVCEDVDLDPFDGSVWLAQSSQLSNLANDYGIPISTKENPDRQKDWVQYAYTWLDKKGAAEAYQTLGKLTGYNVTCDNLYRIDPTTYPGSMVPEANLYAALEPGDGRLGGFDADNSEGTLWLADNGRLHFSSPTAKFRAGDVGLQIQDPNASLGKQFFTIESVISGTEVEFTASDFDSSMTLPIFMQWKVVRLYATEPPALPKLDHFRLDLMQSYLGASVFHVDMFSWDPAYRSSLPVYIASTTALANNRYKVTAEPTQKLLLNSPSGTFAVGDTVNLGSSLTGTICQVDSPTQVIVRGVFATPSPGVTVTSSSGGSAVLASSAYATPGVVLSSPFNWAITVNGVKYYLDTLPVPASGTAETATSFTFEVTSSSTVPTGSASLAYETSTTDSYPSYGPSNAIRLTISEIVGPGENDPELLPDDFIERLKQVTPAHVRLITEFV